MVIHRFPARVDAVDKAGKCGLQVPRELDLPGELPAFAIGSSTGEARVREGREDRIGFQVTIIEVQGPGTRFPDLADADAYLVAGITGARRLMIHDIVEVNGPGQAAEIRTV